MKNFKRMKSIILIFILVLFFGACKMQTTRYVGLFVDVDTITEQAREQNDILIPTLSDSSVVKSVYDSLQTIDSPMLDEKLITNEDFDNQELRSDSVDFISNKIGYQSIDSLNVIRRKKNVLIRVDSNVFSKNNANNYQNKKSSINESVYVNRVPGKTKLLINDIASDEKIVYLIAQNDSLKALLDEIIALLKQKPLAQDTVYIEKEVVKTVAVKDNSADNENLKRIAAQNELIERLQNQVTALQSQQSYVHDTVYIEKEVLKTVQLSNDKKDSNNIAHIIAQNDSIKLLQSQLIASQNEPSTILDTVYVEKEVVKTVSITEAPNTDTIHIIAYYEKNSVIPIAADSTLNELKSVIDTKNVLKIIISGYTDISGNSVINKAITRKRILYFSGRIADFFSVEKIFYQNFGDTFASNKGLKSDRRIVLTLIFKK